MSKPSCEVNAGIYVLKWADYNLLLRADRLKDRSEAVSAEIVIKSNLPGQPQHLHQARLNLTSTTSRRQLASFLTNRYGELPPWGDILEQACVIILEKYREGEPPIKLGELPVREALRYRVAPLLVEKQANLIYGAGQSGKSLLALYLAVLIESPLNHNGLSTEPGKVLFIDYETDEDEVAHRVRSIQAGLNLGMPTDILYRYGRMPLADDIEQIQRIVVENELDVVMVDSLGMAAGGDQDKSTDIIRYFQALRTLKVTTLTIDHVNKEGKLYGNVYKFNEARCIFEVKASSEPGVDHLDVGLYHRKMNNGRLNTPLGFSFHFEDTRYTIRKQDLTLVPDLAGSLPLRQQIASALQHGALSVEDIAEATQQKSASIRVTLNRYKQQFQPVYQDGVRENLWGLKAEV